MQELRIQPDINLTLDLFLSPRMLQMLKVLHLSYLEMVEHITKEEEENVMLEVERKDEYVEFIQYLNSDKKIKKEADFPELPGLQNVKSTTENLEEHLLKQLELEELDELQYAIGKMIIEDIDDFGYVVNYPALRENISHQLHASASAVDNVLKVIQTFDPEGVGARDLKECLLIQVREHNFESDELEELLEKVILDHLEYLGQEKYQDISKALGIPESGVREIASFIKNNLTPHPGNTFGGEINHVIPSFAIEPAQKGCRVVNLESRYGPILNISPQYLKMLEDPKTDAKTKEFLREKLKSAKNLIEDYTKRSETLDRIVRKIADTQSDFLEKGAKALRPLTQKSLADEFGLHPSTISRSVGGKYIQTPQGLFPLRFLCPRGPKGLTASKIMMLIKETVDTENKNNPFSDNQIREKLKALGVEIDRRTVAHYRKELKIPKAEERKIG